MTSKVLSIAIVLFIWSVYLRCTGLTEVHNLRADTTKLQRLVKKKEQIIEAYEDKWEYIINAPMHRIMRTNEQNVAFHALVGKLGIEKEQKKELVEQFSEGRTSTSTALTFLEMDKLIKFLKMTENSPDKAQKMRRKIFSICHEMAWTTFDVAKGKMVVDQVRLEAYLLKYGHMHKSLKSYSAKELPKLVTQFENLLKSQYAKE